MVNTRKILCLFFVVLTLCMVGTSAAFADRYSDLQKEVDVLYAKGEEFEKSILKLASQIMLNNKPVFETQMSKKERSYMYDDGTKGVSPKIYNRVWAKDYTIVVGCAGKNKKFELKYIATRDPNFVFAGGIRAGANVNVIEKFIGKTIAQASAIYDEYDGLGACLNYENNGKYLNWGLGRDTVYMDFSLKNKNTISQITYNTYEGTEEFYLPISEKTVSFLKDTVKKMGFDDVDLPEAYYE